jgi:PAS domain S-box-containing protein
MQEHSKENLQEIIKGSEERFRTITDTLPNMVWEAEADGTYSYINKQLLDWTALTIDQINAGGWSAIFHPDDNKKILAAWEEAITNKTEFNCEYRMKDIAGEYFWFLGKTVPVKNEAGDVIKWVGTSTNINEQKKQKKRLKKVKLNSGNWQM